MVKSTRSRAASWKNASLARKESLAGVVIECGARTIVFRAKPAVAASPPSLACAANQASRAFNASLAADSRPGSPATEAENRDRGAGGAEGGHPRVLEVGLAGVVGAQDRQLHLGVWRR